MPTTRMPIHRRPSRRQSPLAPTPVRLFFIFTRIGLTSFGGGLSGWLRREFVDERQWLDRDEFLNGLSLSQALPGINVKNLAIWIGYRLCVTSGAIAGFSCILLAPAMLIVLLGVLLAALARFPATHSALAGAAAGAVGLSLAMAVTAVRRLPRRAMTYIVMVATFVSIGLLHLPTAYVVLVAAGASVIMEYARLGGSTRREAVQRQQRQ